MALKNTVSFTENQLNIMKQLTTRRTYQRGVDLCQQPDVDDGFYVVHKGEVKVTLFSDDGRAYTLFLFKPSDMFSMFSFLRTPNCEVTLTSDSTLDFISQKQLEALFYEEPALSSTFIHWYETLNAGTMMKMRDLLMYGKRGALASTLIRFMNTYGVNIEDGIRIDARVTNEDLSALIGSSRESVNRLLKTYRESNIIRFDRRRIVIMDRENLERDHDCMKCPKEICHI